MGPGAFDSILNDAMAELEQQRVNLGRLHRGLEEITGAAFSKRRQVSVTVDARGDITELKFHGRGYRNLSPAELAEMIVDTIRQARQSAQTTMLESLRDALPEGADVADIATGHYDWAAALDDALTLPQPLVELLSGLSLNLGAPREPEQHRAGDGGENPDPGPDEHRDAAGGSASDAATDVAFHRTGK